MGILPPARREPLELAIIGAQAAVDRVHSLAGQYEQAHIALGEALFWLCSADDALKNRHRQGIKAYKDTQAADPHGILLWGIHHVRNFVAHEPVAVAHDGSKPFLAGRRGREPHDPRNEVAFISPTFVWPDPCFLPLKEHDPKKPNNTKRERKHVYDAMLAGNNCDQAISAGIDWCWWQLNLWEGSGANTQERAVSSCQRPCPDCGGLAQMRSYDEPSYTPGRRTFWCVSANCDRSSLPALVPAD